MKNIGVFVSESFQFLEVKFSIYLNRSVFVLCCIDFNTWLYKCHVSTMSLHRRQCDVV